MTTREDYGDLASGSVLQSAPGFPAFPVRLAQEMFLRAAKHLGRDPLTLWDPCCGSGYLATVLGLLNRRNLREIVCSDIAPEATELATRNLHLLTRDGLAERAQLLRQRAREFDKPSYDAAADAAERLSTQLQSGGGDLSSRVLRTNALDPQALAAALPPSTPDLVITDAPYGNQTSWTDDDPQAGDPLVRMLTAVASTVDENAVVAVCAQTRKVPLPPGAKALDRFRVGNRAVAITRAGALRQAGS